MNDFDHYLDYEEEFYSRLKKESRQDRKARQKKDRSKYKKTDQEQSPMQCAVKEGQLEGRVISVTSKGYFVQIKNQRYLCSIKGLLKKEITKHKNLVAVGDEVFVEPASPNEGVIAGVGPRKSVLARLDNLSRRKLQLIAANVDLVFIVISIHSPSLKPSLVDRYLISAKKGGMESVIVLNKMDLLKELSMEEKELYQTFIETHRQLNTPLHLVSAKEGQGLEGLKQAMLHKTSVFSGQSGVGKTSLINQILGTHLSIGEIVKKTRKGSHTTTTANLIPLTSLSRKEGEEPSGFVVDTPGIKSFGVWDIRAEELQRYYPEIMRYARDCHYPNCQHVNEPGCSVKEAVSDGQISHLRYSSYLNLLEEETLQEWE